MWMDSDGVAHTVALPGPAKVATPGFVASFAALVAVDPDAVADALDEAEMRCFDLLEGLDTGNEEPYVGAAPPTGLMRGEATNVAQLTAAIDAVDIRWRLDVVLALGDLVDPDDC